MSIARIYTTKGPVRKDGLTCGKCGTPIVKGVDRRRTFAVGFRGWEQTRCMATACTPARSELESSAVSSVYAAQDGIDYDALQSMDDFTNARDEVADAAEEVADEYEASEMYEVNEMLRERAEMLRSAADELRNWEPEDDEPEEEVDCEACEGTGDIDGDDTEDPTECEDCNGTGQVENEVGHEEWADAARESLQAAIDEMELP